MAHETRFSGWQGVGTSAGEVGGRIRRASWDVGPVSSTGHNTRIPGFKPAVAEKGPVVDQTPAGTELFREIDLLKGLKLVEIPNPAGVAEQPTTEQPAQFNQEPEN